MELEPKKQSETISVMEVSKTQQVQPLIHEPYSYDNIVQNPIVKPIAEADRSIRDLDELIYKKLTDAIRDQQWVNSVLNESPFYEDSGFVARLIKLAQGTQDVIKLQDLQLKTLKECIKEIHELVEQKYGVRVSESGGATYQEVKLEFPEGMYLNYLNKLTSNGDEKISQIATEILKLYEKDNDSKTERRRFEVACVAHYKELIDKVDKDIAAKIIRMEISD